MDELEQIERRMEQGVVLRTNRPEVVELVASVFREVREDMCWLIAEVERLRTKPSAL